MAQILNLGSHDRRQGKINKRRKPNLVNCTVTAFISIVQQKFREKDKAVNRDMLMESLLGWKQLQVLLLTLPIVEYSNGVPLQVGNHIAGCV